jgi:hypothetical protein
LGHDVLTSHDIGKSGLSIPDLEVLAYATETHRILVTLNRKHFVHLHQSHPDHAGLIVCTVDTNFAALAERIHEAVNISAEMQNVLIRINRPNPEA